jgi:hypothetical protein
MMIIAGLPRYWRGKMKKRNCVWVVEINEHDKWQTTLNISFTKEHAILDMRDLKFFSDLHIGTAIRYRIRKYVAEEGKP